MVFTVITVALASFAPAWADPGGHGPPAPNLFHPTAGVGVLMTAPPGGSWQYIENIWPNSGSDFETFKRGRKTYGVFGTLAQGFGTHAGQRIVQLADGGVVNPTTVQFLADHTSANCFPLNPGGTLGLQHDVQVTPFDEDQAEDLRSRIAQLIVDSTDAQGRCHDTQAVGGGARGGIELADITQVDNPREIHLTRHFGENHNSTVDEDRPWIVYGSTSDAQNYIDIVNIKSCFGSPRRGETRANFIARLRLQCRPIVTRFQFDNTWTEGTVNKTPNACHDITYADNRLYCAAINATVIFDVSKAFTSSGNVKGTSLPCDLLAPNAPSPGAGQPGHPGTAITSAWITDCSEWSKSAHQALSNPPVATGIKLVGIARHAGRDPTVGPPNSHPDEDISISHESDPTPDGDTLFITDERGGGVVPPGASCLGPNSTNNAGNGGIHFYDISDPSNPVARTTPTGDRAVFRAEPNLLTPLPIRTTFCTSHVIEQVPDENRIFVAWYGQGTRVLDFSIDDQGRVSFQEIAQFIPTQPAPAIQWTAKPFLIKDNPDGTRTYYLAANNISESVAGNLAPVDGRGIDVYSFTAFPNFIDDDDDDDGDDDDDDDDGDDRFAPLSVPSSGGR
jgi:hypothetical protein